jgi:hypothetical protein
MSTAYCDECGGSFVKDAETDTICGDCDPGEGESEVVVTESGYDWGWIVSQLEWDLANATDIDALDALLVSIENQLEGEYWELMDDFVVTLTTEQAALLTELRTKWAEEGI